MKCGAPLTVVSGHEKDGLEQLELRFEPLEESVIDSPPDITKESKVLGSNWDVVVVEFVTRRISWPLYLKMKVTENLYMHRNVCNDRFSFAAG